MFWLYLALIAVVSYIIGGANGSILASRLIYRKDIRDYGSGNAGLTNFYRTFGKSAVWVIVIDCLKTVIPIVAGGLIMGGFERVLLGRLVAGLFVMLGHCFPLFYKFKGGKTLLSGGFLVLFVDWRVALLAWGIFVLMALLTRYVSLGGICAGAMLPLASLIFRVGTWEELLIIALCGALIIARHKDNIKRLVKGEERKFSFRKRSE